jgi:DNA-binding response OmpR family regulator
MARIYVVDDNPDVRHVIVYSLMQQGHDVAVHRDGESALEALLHDPPELMVLDIMMPGCDGFEILEQMRNWGLQDTTRTIVLTARATEEDRRHALDLGADDYMSKPFDPEELASRASRLLGQTEERAGEAARPQTPQGG